MQPLKLTHVVKFGEGGAFYFPAWDNGDGTATVDLRLFRRGCTQTTEENKVFDPERLRGVPQETIAAAALSNPQGFVRVKL